MEVKKDEKCIYCCGKCGLILETLQSGIGIPLCCGVEMEIAGENVSDGKVEKHVPVIRRYGDICQVLVGEEPHPMTEEHHIVWIEIHFNNKIFRHHLKHDERPEAEFCGVPPEAAVTARIYCNLHGVWCSEKKCTNCK